MAMPWNGQPQWWLQILSLSVLCWQLTRCAEQLTSWSSSTWSVAERRPDWQTGWKGAAWLGLGLCHRLACQHVLVAVHFHAHLWRAAGRAGRAGRAGSGRRAGALLRGSVRLVFQAVLCPCGCPDCPGLPWSLLHCGRWPSWRAGVWFTGFPWGAGGYAHTGGPLAGYAPWLGVYGVGAVAAWAAFMLAGLLAGSGRSRWATGLALGVVLALRSGGPVVGPAFTRSAGTQSVALLQGNIPQDEKFQPGTGVADALRWYGGATAGQPVPAWWWPRKPPFRCCPSSCRRLLGSVAGPFRRWPAGGADRYAAGQPRRGLHQCHGRAETRPVRRPYRYDKHHLVPFGEFIPPFFKWFLAMMNIPLGDFNRGTLAPAFV